MWCLVFVAKEKNHMKQDTRTIPGLMRRINILKAHFCIDLETNTHVLETIFK